MSDRDENEQEDNVEVNEEENIEDLDPEVPLIHAEFTDAYSFRSLVEYLNLTNDSGNLIFTPKGIYYSRENDGGQVLNDLLIYTHELTRYEYNIEKEKFIVGLNILQFKGATKKIGKKDIARLSIFPAGVCLQVIGSPKNSSGDDMDLIRTQRLNHNIYSMEGYQADDEPNFTESMQKFTAACSDQASCKDEFITVIGLEHGIIMEARQGGNLRASIKCLGQIDDTASLGSSGLSDKTRGSGGKNIRIVKKHPNEIVRYRIPRRIISALSKLTNISPNGTIKFYLQPNLPIKASIHVSTYGKLSIYLRNNK